MLKACTFPPLYVFEADPIMVPLILDMCPSCIMAVVTVVLIRVFYEQSAEL